MNSHLPHERASANHLALLRIMVFGLWMADVIKDPIVELARIPMSEFQAVGVLSWLPMSFWSGIHTAQALKIGWGVLLIFLALSAAGIPLYPIIAAITCILLTLYQGMIYGFSKVTHAELVPLYMTYLLAIFPAADALSIRRLRSDWSCHPVYQAAILAATIVLLCPYMFTGVRRLFVGGLEIFTNGAILSMIADGSATPDHFQRSIGLWVLASPFRAMLLQVGFVFISFFEVTSLFCLSSTRYRRCWLAVLLLFHVLSWPLLQTLFVFNILLIGVLLFDLEGIARRIGIWSRLLPPSPETPVMPSPRQSSDHSAPPIPPSCR